MRLDELLDSAVIAGRDLDVDAVLGRTAQLRRRRAVFASAVAVVVLLIAFAVVWTPSRPDVILSSPEADIFPLPPAGEVDAVVTESGARVWLVHHEDGEVTALATVAPQDESVVPAQLGWCPASRLFEDVHGGSVFDEYGRLGSGGAANDLVCHELDMLADARVRVGRLLPAAPRSEVTLAPWQVRCSGDRGKAPPQLDGLTFPDYPPAQPVLRLRDVIADGSAEPTVVWAQLLRRSQAEPVMCEAADAVDSPACDGTEYRVDDPSVPREEEPGTTSYAIGHMLIRTDGTGVTEVVLLPDVYRAANVTVAATQCPLCDGVALLRDDAGEPVAALPPVVVVVETVDGIEVLTTDGGRIAAVAGFALAGRDPIEGPNVVRTGADPGSWGLDLNPPRVRDAFGYASLAGPALDPPCYPIQAPAQAVVLCEHTWTLERDGQVLVTLPTDMLDWYESYLSPDASTFLLQSRDDCGRRQAWVAPGGGGALRQLLPDRPSGDAIGFLPDGRALVRVGSDPCAEQAEELGLVVVDVTTGALQPFAPGARAALIWRTSSELP